APYAKSGSITPTDQDPSGARPVILRDLIKSSIKDDEAAFRIDWDNPDKIATVFVMQAEYVDIPQNGNLGTMITYMGWHKITSKTSNQYKLREDARNNGRYEKSKPEYYGLIDGRISIATKSNIGNILKVVVGDYVDVTFKSSDGTEKVYACIIGDIKGADAPNIWGHNDGRGVVEIIYHDYSPTGEYNKNANNPWGSGRVTRITKVGNYYSK
ncbi:MAG: hypothetical protein FWD21_04710, partial [Peptococcaceae bacterium]|nr:hypothetical protein [Peptococcaceae bacterium]